MVPKSHAIPFAPRRLSQREGPSGSLQSCYCHLAHNGLVYDVLKAERLELKETRLCPASRRALGQTKRQLSVTMPIGVLPSDNTELAQVGVRRDYLERKGSLVSVAAEATLGAANSTMSQPR